RQCSSVRRQELCLRHRLPCISLATRVFQCAFQFDKDFLERYAREAQADKLFKESLEIADKATPENVSVARLQVDVPKWHAGKLAPKKYGDHISHDIKGPGANFQPAVLIQIGSAEREDDAKLIEGD